MHFENWKILIFDSLSAKIQIFELEFYIWNNVNFLKNEILKVWFLLNMRFWNVIFVKNELLKCDFFEKMASETWILWKIEILNRRFFEKWACKMWIFVKHVILKMWIFWKSWFWTCEFLDENCDFAPVCSKERPPANFKTKKLSA